jgi:hypothetical protein
MTKQRAHTSKTATRRPGRRRDRAMAAEAMQSPAPTIREMMVMDGVRPRETILHEFTLEDFGLDVPRVIHSEHP